jgi:hypothetical protein
MTQTSQFAQLPEPLPEPVRLVGILLVVQGLLRLALLSWPLLRFGLAYVNIFTVMSAVLGFAGIAAGILALQRYALARGFGLVFCAIGLLYQLYGLGQILYNHFEFRLPWTSWVLIPAYIAIYAIGLVVFVSSPYYKAGPASGSAAPKGH